MGQAGPVFHSPSGRPAPAPAVDVPICGNVQRFRSQICPWSEAKLSWALPPRVAPLKAGLRAELLVLLIINLQGPKKNQQLRRGETWLPLSREEPAGRNCALPGPLLPRPGSLGSGRWEGRGVLATWLAVLSPTHRAKIHPLTQPCLLRSIPLRPVPLREGPGVTG